MQYALNLREGNKEAHIDIESIIQKQKDGWLSIKLRVNAGNIVDCVKMENVDVKRKYLAPTKVIIEELSVTHYSSNRGTGNPIR